MLYLEFLNVLLWVLKKKTPASSQSSLEKASYAPELPFPPPYACILDHNNVNAGLIITHGQL